MINKKILVAGGICIDITPDLSSVPAEKFLTLLQPGKLISAKGLSVSTGCAVANVGLTLSRLGVPVRMIGKVGDDLFGMAMRDILSGEVPSAYDDLVIDSSSSTSYSIILNPPGFDRTFIHSNGANEGFYASDIPLKALQWADLFQFGYPSLMRSVYRADGAELVSILQKARRAGLSTSVDFSLPDPTTPAGEVDWPLVLANSLPLVDVFVPSVEELTFLLKRETYNRINDDPSASFIDLVTPELCFELSEQVLDYGVKIVLIKIGERGLYLRTAGPELWKRVGRGLDRLNTDWYSRELWAPAFSVEVRTTNGAGDAAIAGFLSSLVQGVDPVTALQMSAAVGAYRVEGKGQAGDLPTWEAIYERVKAGWQTLPLDLTPYHWQLNPTNGIWQRD